MAKEKGQKDKQLSTEHTYKTKDRATRTPLTIQCIIYLLPCTRSNTLSFYIWTFHMSLGMGENESELFCCFVIAAKRLYIVFKQ